MDQQKTPDTRVTFQRVFDAMTERVDEVLAAENDVRSVAVIVDWKAGSNSLPFGVAIGRRGGISSPIEIVGCASQITKMFDHLCGLMEESLQAADQLAGRLAEEIKKREQRIIELDAAIAERAGSN